MRNSFATAVPVTGTPLPVEVRQYIHGLISDGLTGITVDFPYDDADVARVRYLAERPDSDLVEYDPSRVDWHRRHERAVAR
jgi:hypothetical protein